MSPRPPYKAKIYRHPKPPVRYRKKTASQEIAAIDTGQTLDPLPPQDSLWHRLCRMLGGSPGNAGNYPRRPL